MSKRHPTQTTPPPSGASFDLAYLLAEIEELRRIAEGRGLGTLVYMLDCAAIETKWQIRLEREEAQEGPADGRET
jgi:hypothetical protein